MLANALVAVSALIAFSLGCAHLYLTYFSNAFAPRDVAVETRLKEVSPKISSQTTMWRAQIGFHASHSLGVILFGVIYGYLSLFQGALLFQSHFLAAVGAFVLLCYLVLAKLYWFIKPLVGIAVAFTCYMAGLVIAYA